MDIGVDQGSARGDLGLKNDGRYLYKLDDGKFDIDRFNRDFDQYKQKRKDQMKEEIDRKLAELNRPPEVIPVYNLSIGQILVNMKDSVFDIIDDVINFKIYNGMLLKNNRMFYLGLFIIIIALLMFFYMFFIFDGQYENIFLHSSEVIRVTD